MRRSIVLGLMLAVVGSGLAVATPTMTTETPVYIEMSDGARLQATVYRPDAPTPVPVIVHYGPYGDGGVTRVEQPGPPRNPITPEAVVARGYALVEVSMRGTGCSSGSFDVFSDRQALDGAEVVEWAGTRPWSDGKVAMDGNSYLGITQLFVAALQPPHLAAIAPFHVLGDLYRDVVYPGGIFNDTFSLGWALGLQPGQATAFGTASGLAAGDTACAQNQPSQSANPGYNVAAWATVRPFDGTDYWSRSPLRVIQHITVPTIVGQAWQDDQVGARGVGVFEALRAPKKLVLTNGVHPTPKQVFAEQVLRFFDYWLKGIDNGIMSEPPVTVFYETDASLTANFARTYADWPPPELNYKPLFLRANGALADETPTGENAADVYAYPASVGASTQAWAAPPVGALTYQTEPLANDLLIAGPIALTLYASSTATDTDFYARLSEVDPSGNVTYVQKGMLRASHRRIDPARSSAQRPFHPHTSAEPLNPGEIYRFDIELLPAAQAFRSGSRVRLDIVAPPLLPELWGFVPSPYPAVNSVYHAPERASTLWLPVVPTAGLLPRARACGSLIGQPCRAG